ncbi:MAG TPA: TetR/AcrR family transcriptional regulator [Ktedonobacterales bacterium]|nr:TetR/AcrR family transcriptional regulator [Ktedonobacterales bacterium]
MPARAGKREAERKAQVLAAARTCIVALGYERVTIRDIAEAAGVSTGTVVFYFREKESVLEAALLGKIQDTGIAFRAALEGAPSARERLQRLVEASLPANDEVRDEWRLWLTFWGEATRNGRLRAVSERQHRRWTRFLGGIVREGVTAGEFAPVDPEATSAQIAALIDGMAVQATLGNPTLSADRMRVLCLDALRRLLPTP